MSIYLMGAALDVPDLAAEHKLVLAVLARDADELEHVAVVNLRDLAATCGLFVDADDGGDSADYTLESVLTWLAQHQYIEDVTRPGSVQRAYRVTLRRAGP